MIDRSNPNMFYFDEWYKKWVPCEVIHQGEDSLSEWNIRPSAGALVGHSLWVNPQSLRQSLFFITKSN